MKLRLLIVSLVSLLCSLSALAAKDPVSWSITPAAGFSSTTQVGHQSIIRYTFTNTLPLPVTLNMETVIFGGNFIMHDECSNISLLPKRSCPVFVAFNPAYAGQSSFQLIYGYDKNRIPLPTLRPNGTGEPTNTVLSGYITGLPPTFNVGNTVSFGATFINKGSTTLTGCTTSPAFSTSGVPGTITNTGSGTPACTGTLAPGAACAWTGSVTSSTEGILTVIGQMSCTGGVVAKPEASTFVQNSTGCLVHAAVQLPLPATTHRYSDNIVVFKYTNQCATAVSINPTVTVKGATATVTPASASFYTPTTSSNIPQCGTSLGSSASCLVAASIIPQTISPSMMVTSSTKVNGGATVSATTAAPVLAPAYNHTINFINQCPFPVWYGVENVPGNANVTDPTPNPTPSAYLLAAQTPGVSPVVKSITIPGNYEGEFFPRTGCTISGNSFVCDTGSCNSPASTGQCNGDGVSPYTRIEEVFFSTILGAGYQGTYDISIINGISIPAEMKGLGPSNSNPVFDDTPFYCTGAGAPIQPTQPAGSETLGACSWNFDVSGAGLSTTDVKYFNFVTNGTVNNNCSTPCSADEACGMAYSGTAGTAVVQSCGQLIGYWTINQSCSADTTYDGSFTSPPPNAFQCGEVYNNPSVHTYPLGATYYDIYSCNTQPSTGAPQQLGSCYPSTTGNLCCGAANWNEAPYNLTAQDINAAITNPDWTNGTSSPLSPTPFDAIYWMKLGCPTAYTYPYDDHSSSFRCYTSDSAQSTMVKMDFDVVFCPGGLTGQLSLTP